MSKKLLKSTDLKNPWIEAFRLGKVTDMLGIEHNYSESDLQDLNEGIQSQLKNGYKPPFVKGHPKLNEPRMASIVDSKIEDGIVKVMLDEVNPDFAEEVKKGGWKYVSSAVYSNLKKGLRHLGALGAVGPAMKGMQELCFGEGMFADIDDGEKEIFVFASDYSWDRLVPLSAFESLIYRLSGFGTFFRNQREEIIASKGIEKANEALPEWQVKEFENINAVIKNSNDFPRQTVPVSPTESSSNDAPAFGEGATDNGESPSNEPNDGDHDGNSMKVTPEQFAEMQNENAILKQEIAKNKAENILKAKKADGAAFSDKLDAMISQGRLNEPLKNDFLSMFAVAQEVQVNEEGFLFSEDSALKVKPTDLIHTMLDKLPKVVEFGELEVGATTKEAYSLRLKKYKDEQDAKGRRISFAEAASELKI